MIYSDVINSLMHTHSDALSGKESVMDFYNIFSLTSCQSIDDLDELLRRLCDYLLSGNNGSEEVHSAGAETGKPVFGRLWLDKAEVYKIK